MPHALSKTVCWTSTECAGLLRVTRSCGLIVTISALLRLRRERQQADGSQDCKAPAVSRRDAQIELGRLVAKRLQPPSYAPQHSLLAALPCLEVSGSPASVDRSPCAHTKWRAIGNHDQLRSVV